MSERATTSRSAAPPRLEFRIRGRDMNRVEAVSDVVFGFALTLLVVSLQVPRTYPELLEVMRGFPAFALTFVLLMVVWTRHYYFFRYYGLDDTITIVLNTALLFVVLFYVYPLKFLFSIWLAPLTGASVAPVKDSRSLMMIFGSAFSAVYLVFAAMLWHAYRMREALELNRFEIAFTLHSLTAQLMIASIGLLSILIAFLLKPDQADHVGYIYATLPVLLRTQGALWRRRKRAMEIDLAPRPL